MALVCPDIESITNASNGYDMMAVFDKADKDALQGTDAGNGVIMGCEVTQNSGSNMEINVAAGVVSIAGTWYGVTAQTAISVGASGTYDRRDLVAIGTAGTASVIAGSYNVTAGWTRTSTGVPPVKPAIPSSSVMVAEIAVPNGTTEITTALNIVDKTSIIFVTPGTLLGRTSYAPTTAATVACPSTTALTIYSATNQKVTFIAPPSGNIKVDLTAWVKMSAATAAATLAWGLLNNSGGALVGELGLVYTSPVATAADDGASCEFSQVITGLTAGLAYQLNWAAIGSATTADIIAQGSVTTSSVPTGKAAVMEVTAA